MPDHIPDLMARDLNGGDMTVLEFVEGPMWYFAATVFLIGAAWRVF